VPLLLLVLVVAGAPAADPASALAPSDADRLPPVVLDRPARAESAITGLGPGLSLVAARHGLAAGELRDLLRADRTLCVDRATAPGCS
jgi:hypothetical protein